MYPVELAYHLKMIITAGDVDNTSVDTQGMFDVMGRETALKINGKRIVSLLKTEIEFGLDDDILEQHAIKYIKGLQAKALYEVYCPGETDTTSTPKV